ncbi:MAG: T9SS type A sorting domain-containing protein [Flavobacteriales bacterium]|jgi:hypothetical protein|nr:T9SS type A sorting domain-containing protein [Flavobacteriales bacterium]MBT3963148.1 T9SS type A sorting domain-containing protein [Flavobacteriales bacterium]MBT4705973.1 T9SS type A sorting domain-containing protein [Flavobacteriales bacterium]MBT4931505.1 T9SS type A sorting domain-containing protein [Flavobacteriales bacterium]MBT5131617.1 T9SS type A sorting domain-containing protein [Flavobacteriales bacterium]
MKNLSLSLIGVSIALLSYGQVDSYSENFDSFTAGDYMGVVGMSEGWTTWSGTTGGAEDVQVVDSNSNSASNSLYFYSTSGGPQDVVLAFDDAYVDGIFEFEMMMYVTSGTDAYFNFQSESTPGVVWAMEFYCENGAISMSNTAGPLLSGTMSTDQWVRISYNIDITNNIWEAFVDSTSIGGFINPNNKVASLNLYPAVVTATESEYWIDDISWSWDTIPVVPTNDTTQIIIGGDTAWVIDGDTFEMWDGNYVPFGLEEVNNASVSIYPNPATDQLNVAFGREVSNMDVSLFDIQGKQVLAKLKNVSGRNYSLNVSEIPSGVYVMKGKSKTFNFQKSVIIQH